MEFIRPVADLFGISPVMLIVLTIGGLLLIGFWYLLKFALKIAWKTFSIGCVTILVVLGALYVVSVILSAAAR